MHSPATTPPVHARRRTRAGRCRRHVLTVCLVAATLAGAGAAVGGAVTSAGAAVRYPPGSLGNDISFPQCGRDYPAGAAFGIVGVTGGRAFTGNPCLAPEYRWAQRSHAAPSVYLNVNFAAPTYPSFAAHALEGPAGACLPTQNPCTAYNYGWNAADDAVRRATDTGAFPAMWWLDVETANYWSDAPALNARVIQAALDRLHSQGRSAGVYSIDQMWRRIAGSGFRPGVPVWYAETNPADGYRSASHYCSPAYAFTGGAVWLVQWSDHVDHDYACPTPAAPAPPPGVCLPQPLQTCLLTAARRSSPPAPATPAPADQGSGARSRPGPGGEPVYWYRVRS
jgi:hypothetical protein